MSSLLPFDPTNLPTVRVRSDGDGRISKNEFRERVAAILSAKLSAGEKKELDALFDS